METVIVWRIKSGDTFVAGEWESEEGAVRAHERLIKTASVKERYLWESCRVVSVLEYENPLL